MLIYEQNCLVHQIIEEQFFEANRGHDNRKQIIHDFLMSENFVIEIQISKTSLRNFFLSNALQVTFKEKPGLNNKKTYLPGISLPRDILEWVISAIDRQNLI